MHWLELVLGQDRKILEAVPVHKYFFLDYHFILVMILSFFQCVHNDVPVLVQYLFLSLIYHGIHIICLRFQGDHYFPDAGKRQSSRRRKCGAARGDEGRSLGGDHHFCGVHVICPTRTGL